MEQKRFFLALILSAAILLVWQLFFAPPSSDSTNQPQSTPSASPSPSESVPAPSLPAPVAAASDASLQRTITIQSPLYEVKIDTRGAVPVSWILKQNKENGRPIFAASSTKDERRPLQLIAPEGLAQQPRQAPLRFASDDTALENYANSSNYNVEGVDAAESNPVITLNGNEQKQLTFTLRDESTGIVVTKGFTFNANAYNIGLAAAINRNSQPLSNVQLAIGPNIGDQSIPTYSMYAVAPEAVYAVNGESDRVTSSEIFENDETPGVSRINRQVDWAAVGDTYFAMAAVPASPFNGITLRSSKYEHEVNGTKEDRYLVTNYVPVPAEGLNTRLYVGPKDHSLLVAASSQISEAVKRPIDLDGLIDYGWFSSLLRPLAIPILYAIRNLSEFAQSYGVGIIIFTIILYSLFFPLKWRSSKAMKRAQKLAPRMKEIQEKIKGLKPDDPKLKELQVEQFRLMKEGNMLGGCLTLLIQMPFFFALYKAITISLDFRQAEFLWLPDLSAPDPYHLLPILMAASILVVQLVTPAPTADPLQRKMMAFMVPAIMLYVLWSAPSALLVYWFMGNVILFAQQMIINRLLKSNDEKQESEGDLPLVRA